MTVTILVAFGLFYFMLHQNALLHREVNVKRGILCPKDETGAVLEVKFKGVDCIKDYKYFKEYVGNPWVDSMISMYLNSLGDFSDREEY